MRILERAIWLLLPLAFLVTAEPVSAEAVPGEDPPMEAEEESGEAGEPDDTGIDTVRPATDEEIRRVPTYDESVLYGSETPQGAYLRLAETYMYYSEIGSRTIGHIPLWPRGSLHVGAVELFPYLTGSVTWTNNVDDNEEEESAFILEVGGGVTGQYQMLAGRAAITFGLDYRQRYYSNGDGTEAEAMGGIGLTYSFTPSFWMSAGVKWEHLVDPVGIEYQDDVERDQIYPYVDLGLGDALGSKLQLEAGLDYSMANFADRDYETGDYGEWDLHVKLSAPFYKDTTRVYLRYDYIWRDSGSERVNDMSAGHQFSVGTEGMLPLTRTGRLEGYVEVGYRMEEYAGPDYYTDGSDTLQTDDHSDDGTVVFGVGLRYYAGLRTTIDLRLLRTMEHSSRGNYQVIDRADLWITRVILRDLIGRFAAYAENSEPSAGPQVGGYDVFRWGVGVGLRYIVSDFLDVFLDCDYTSSHTDRAGDETSEFRVTVGVDVYLW